MTLATKIVFIIALIVSIIVPFGYYFLGEKSRRRYKRAIGVNAFFFFVGLAEGVCLYGLIISFMILGNL